MRESRRIRSMPRRAAIAASQGLNGPARIPGVADAMHGQQHVLHDVLGQARRRGNSGAPGSG